MNRREFQSALTIIGGADFVRFHRNSVFEIYPCGKFGDVWKDDPPTKVTAVLLGTAQDGGVPQAGCFCPMWMTNIHICPEKGRNKNPQNSQELILLIINE